jgi:ribonuclease HII
MTRSPTPPVPTQPAKRRRAPARPATRQGALFATPEGPGDAERLYGWPSGPLLIGTDEAGRGPLAGPVVAAAVCLNPAAPLPPGLDDSKRLTERQRDHLFDAILNASFAAAVSFVEAPEIDRVNILQASLGAMFICVQSVDRSLRALGTLSPACATPRVLVDGKQPLPGPWDAQSIIHGDHLSWHIAAASILAKVCRDQWMTDADLRFPGYGFAAHKGYPTATHRAAVAQLGPCPLHRLTFRGVYEHAQPPPPLASSRAPLPSIQGRITLTHPPLPTRTLSEPSP